MTTQLHDGPDRASKLAYSRSAPITFPYPNLGFDDVLVNVKYAATIDEKLLPFTADDTSGLRPAEAKPDIIGGHAGAGLVVALGDGVDDIKVGDAIGIQLINRTCGNCLECNAFDNKVCCPYMQLSGHTVDGTLREYCVCKASEAIRVPDCTPLDAVPPILCVGGTLVRAVEMTSAPKGQIIGIIGATTNVGLLACQYARSLGFQVLVVLSEEEAASPLVDNLDVDYVVHGSPSNILADIQSIIPRGPPAIVVCTATGTPFQLAPQYVRPYGKVVLIGIHPEDLIYIDYPSVIRRAVSIQWAWTGARSETEKALCHLSMRQIQIPRHIKVAEQGLETEQTTKEGKHTHKRGSGVWTVLDIPQTQARISYNSFKSLQFAPETFNFGRYLAYRIEELGVKDLFGVPGDSNLNILDVILETRSLNFIGCCNELDAGYAADGYARTSTSHVAVVVVPFVVGSLSVLNAICGAYTDRLKVIVIAGCPDTSRLLSNEHLHHTPGVASMDVALHAFRDVTAAAVRVSSIKDAVSILDDTLTDCVRQSLPVYIEIANDLAYGKCSAPKPLSAERDSTSQIPDYRDVVEAFSHAWQSAYMPVILVGPWAHSSCTPTTLTLLAEKLGCAVLVQPDARGFPESHPQFCGTFWPSVFNPLGEKIVMKSDLWIVIGGRWSDLHTLGNLDINKELHRIIDLQPNSARLRSGCSHAILLQDLMLDLISSEVEENRRSVLAIQASIPGVVTSSDRDNSRIDSPVTLSNVVDGLHRLIGENDILIADTGETWFISQQVKLPPAATCQLQLVYASLGWALPAGLGCQLACPKGRAILLIGDGAFQMTGHEISTMIRQKVNPIIFVFNNMGYRTEIAIQDGPYNYIANWDYSRLAACYSRPPHTVDVSEPPGSDPDLSFITMQVRTCNGLNQAVDRAKAESWKLSYQPIKV
ncbi:hypothetical protein N7532_000304 [Penicillium argentinense]|uniref:Pyruvate decarboxylase n=1 Tax=Penicillium argentinense TaxID=1131581 RepID=A0A9W9KMH9_9EURO|nr:uncharacterized protein N7532_000304 [Penicillium argentinense]KAJ5112259.1 hypothetical protein N7532_000304 [Penicillium argentinense]